MIDTPPIFNMGLRNAQTTLDTLYGARDAFLAGVNNPQAEISAYTLEGGRRVEIRSFSDLQKLEELIRYYESIVVSSVPVVVDFSQEC